MPETSAPSPTPVRVRIAPSPTGNLHVGTARTALFNYLFAKHTGGVFLLRIEDTDLDRSEARYIQDIYDGLKLLGLTWDEGPDIGGPEGPYTQSERLDLYRTYARRLLETDHAYRCYCTVEELAAEKEAAMADKRPYVYSRRCCDPAVAAALQADPSRVPTIRFRIPETPKNLTFHDIVRGEVSFDTALIGDFVIEKSNGTASYNFAVVVDDITMRISHVIRGEDHVSNTPKQILLYEALGHPIPQFAHVGMILAPDRSKLSKRHGATAVSEFIRRGYLPEAFCNFLTLLGWSPPDGQEIRSLAEVAPLFTLDRIVTSPAVFDVEKLNWLNGHYIRHMPLPELLARSRPFLGDFPLADYPEDKQLMILEAVREPLTTLSELPEAIGYFFGETVSPEPGEAQAVLAAPETMDILKAFDMKRATLDFASPEALAEGLKAFTHSLKPMKTKTIMWAIRAALTGRVHGADLSKTLYLLGEAKVATRLAAVLRTASRH